MNRRVHTRRLFCCPKITERLTIKIYLVKVDGDAEEYLFHRLSKFINDEKKERIQRQKVEQNARNMLVGEILAKVAIKRTFGVAIEKQTFAYSKFGKPFLLYYPNIHFNTSHSGNYVACGVSDNPIGVDIQKTVLFKPDLARRVCNENELNQIKKSRDKASEFTKLWTQKEAILKQSGEGIASGKIKNCIDNQKLQSMKIEDYWLSVAF